MGSDEFFQMVCLLGFDDNSSYWTANSILRTCTVGQLFEGVVPLPFGLSGAIPTLGSEISKNMHQEVVGASVSQDLPSTCAGGQDDVSLRKLPQMMILMMTMIVMMMLMLLMVMICLPQSVTGEQRH